MTEQTPTVARAADCRYCQRYGKACGRPHGRDATEYGAPAPVNLSYCGHYPHRDHAGCASSVECTAATPSDVAALLAGGAPCMPTDLPTSLLRTGDVVATHGMLVLLDGPVGETTEPGTFASRGRVLNLDQVRAAGLVPVAWLYQDEESVPRWTVQGNDLARWRVVARVWPDLGAPVETRRSGTEATRWQFDVYGCGCVHYVETAIIDMGQGDSEVQECDDHAPVAERVERAEQDAAAAAWLAEQAARETADEWEAAVSAAAADALGEPFPF